MDSKISTLLAYALPVAMAYWFGTPVAFWLHTHMWQGRRSRCGRCGGRRTNNMLSLASKLLNLAVSSQDCTRNHLRRSKIQNFPGGGPPDPPMWRASRACYASRLAHCGRNAIAPPLFHRSNKQSAIRLTKLTLLPTGLCGSSVHLLC